MVEHGIVDPGYRYTGERARRRRVVINEPLRRAASPAPTCCPGSRVAASLDVFGMGTDDLGHALGSERVHGRGDLPQHRMHDELARRRVYLHPMRWTSLGLSLIEAMHAGHAGGGARHDRGGGGGAPAEVGVCATDPARLARVSARARWPTRYWPGGSGGRPASTRWRTSGSTASSPTGTSVLAEVREYRHATRAASVPAAPMRR